MKTLIVSQEDDELPEIDRLKEDAPDPEIDIDDIGLETIADVLVPEKEEEQEVAHLTGKELVSILALPLEQHDVLETSVPPGIASRKNRFKIFILIV